MMNRWEDYYKLLQVHYDAEFDVIEAAYKRLCKKYHPDINNSKHAEEKIKKINVAYEVLKDQRRRKEYHEEWIEKNRYRSFSPQTTTVQPPKTEEPKPAPPQPKPAPQREHTWKDGTDFSYDENARKVLIEYMITVSEFKYETAYNLLTDLNKANITFEKFKEWQDAVSKLYSLGGFKTKVFKSYKDHWLGTKKYDKAIEFEIDASEKDIKTGTVTDSHFTKVVVQEKNLWKVYLEYTDLDFLIYKFNFLNYSKDKTTMLEQIVEKEARVDPVTGMFNKRGFFDFIERENNRYIRYRSVFTIAIFAFTEEGSEKIDQKHIEHMAYCFNNYVRNTDIAAHVGNGVFALMMVETDHADAIFPCKRTMKGLKSELSQNLNIAIEIKTGVHEHSGHDPIKSFEIACEFAGVKDVDQFKRQSAML